MAYLRPRFLPRFDSGFRYQMKSGACLQADPALILCFAWINPYFASALAIASWKSRWSVKISFLYGFFFCLTERLMIAASTQTLTAKAKMAITPCMVGSAAPGRTAASITPSVYKTGSTANTPVSWNSGNTCANMHQIANVLARFWIQPPLFQKALAKVGASSSARPQYQACVGRLLYVYSKFQRSYTKISSPAVRE